MGTLDARRAPWLERIERRALHARTRRQGVRARHERRAAEPAQLRRHGTSVGGVVSLGPDRGRGARRRRAHARRRPAGDRRGRLLAGRQSRAEAGGRVRRARPDDAHRRRGGVADHRDQRVHAGAGAARQRAVPVEFRARPEAPHASQGPVPPRPFRSDAAERDQDRPRVRRNLHRAVLRLSQRRGLLPPRERDARDRSRPGPGARHHGG